MSRIFKSNYIIKYSDVDIDKRIFVESFLKYFEEARFEILNSFYLFSEKNNVNVDYLKNNILYVVTNISLELFNNEKIDFEGIKNKKNILIKSEMKIFQIPFFKFFQTAFINKQIYIKAEISIALIDSHTYKRVTKLEDIIYLTLKKFLEG